MIDFVQVNETAPKTRPGPYNPAATTGPLSADERLAGGLHGGQGQQAMQSPPALGGGHGELGGAAAGPEEVAPDVDAFDVSHSERGPYIEGEMPAPDRDPFVMRETRRLQDTYVSKLGIFLYVYGLGVYLVRTTLGDLPVIPDWVMWTILSGCTFTALTLAIAIRRRPRPWVSILFTLVSAAILTLALMYHGSLDNFSALYLLTLIVPMLFYSPRWAMVSVLGVSALSLVPYYGVSNTTRRVW